MQEYVREEGEYTSGGCVSQLNFIKHEELLLVGDLLFGKVICCSYIEYTWRIFMDILYCLPKLYFELSCCHT